MNRTASLKYDFDTSMWIAVADWNSQITAHGSSPLEAMHILRIECSKHGLWPTDRNFIGVKNK